MKKLLQNPILIISLLLSLNGCATIIGGNTPTDQTTGTRFGPATIADGDSTLTQNRYSALTINGKLTATKIVIANDLSVKGEGIFNQVTVRDDTNIGGDLTCNDCNLEDSTTVNGSIKANDSYFGGEIKFNGSTLELTSRSKVKGNIVSSSANAATVIIDNSTVKGNISFSNANSRVIIKNKGSLKGQVINGTIQHQ